MNHCVLESKHRLSITVLHFFTETYKCGIAKARQTNSVNSIVAGDTAAKGTWPWQVAIIYKGKFKCGGTLVSTHYFISAAHCFRQMDLKDYSIVLGEHHRAVYEGTEQTLTVKRIVRHPAWKTQGPNDIAVVELGAKAVLTKYITPACLPRAGEEVPVGKKCFMSGKILNSFSVQCLNKMPAN